MWLDDGTGKVNYLLVLIRLGPMCSGLPHGKLPVRSTP